MASLSSHLVLWPTACEWHHTFCERQSHHIFSYDQQGVSDFVKGSLTTAFPMTNSLWVTLHILWKAVSPHLFLWPTESQWHFTFVKGSLMSHLFLWPTACGWHCTSCERHILSYYQQEVSDIADFWKAVSSHLFSPTESEWHCRFCKRLSHHIFPMTNSLWVTFQVFWKAASSHLPYDLEQVVSDIAHFVKGSLRSHHILSYDQQEVSDIAYFVKGISLHLSLWATVCEWHCTSCTIQYHHNVSYDQQRVSDTAHFVKGSLITTCPMTNDLWVALQILWKRVLSHLSLLWPTGSEWHCTFCERQSHLFLWPTGSEWDCKFCERQSHHIFSFDQQRVSDTAAHFVNGSLITTCPMINSEWVTSTILWKAVSSYLLILRPTESDLNCTFVQGSLITAFHMTNSLWVTLHILWNAVSFIWLTGSEWHCTLCERQCYSNRFSHDQ